jgi:hypothetical protein
MRKDASSGLAAAEGGVCSGLKKGAATVMKNVCEKDLLPERA